MTATIFIFLIVAAVIAMAIYATKVRNKSIRQFNRRYTSHYVIKHLTQQNFTKAVNIVMDLVQTEGADIEVIYDNQVIFNGYIDIDENGNNRPHFYYNKKVLDANGIIYK